MRRGLVALLLVFAGCGGGESEASDQVDKCFSDVAERYEQAANVVDGDLGPLLAKMSQGFQGMVEGTRNLDIDAVDEALNTYEQAADDVIALGDDFAKELDEARELDIDCP